MQVIELPHQLILFRLAERPHALDVKLVQEILSQVTARKIPHTASYLQGVFDFRGSVIPLINLRLLLNLNNTDRIGNVIVVKIEGQLMGLIVDKVLAILTEQDDLQAVSTHEGDAVGSFVLGFVAHKDMVVEVLDLTTLAATISEKGA